MDLLYEIANELVIPDQELAKTVVVDPIGELYRRLLEEGSQKAIRPSLPQYGDVSKHVERFCRLLCEIPTVNTILVCHELAIRDDATGEIRIIPYTGTQAGSAVLGQQLLGMVDIVGYTGVTQDEEGGVHYQAQLLPGKGRQGGDRFACLGSVRDVNISEWLERILEDEKSSINVDTDLDAAA